MSHLEIYRRLAQLRKLEEFRDSNLDFVTVNENILSFLRYNRNGEGGVYLVALNVGSRLSTDNYEVPGRDWKQGKIVLNTESIEQDGKVISLKNISIKVGQAIIIKISESSKSEL